MKSKILTTDEDLKFYADITSNVLKINYPLSYFKQGFIRAFYDENNNICGGYFFAFDKFRSVAGLPDNEKIKFETEYKNNEVAEMNAMWLSKKVKGNIDNFKFWTRMWLDIINCDRKYIMYTYDEDNTKLRNLYNILNPKIIYRGQTKIVEGMTYSSRESVELASVNYIKYGILHSGDFLVKKLFMSRKGSTRYSHSLLPTIKQKLFVKN